MRLLKSVPAIVLTLFLVVHAILLYGFSRTENTPSHQPLREFPTTINSWRMIQEGVIEEKIQEVLLADDTLTRIYRDDAEDLLVNLFVAYFKSQRTGVNPHSPKNCLPGAGWVSTTSGTVEVSVPNRPSPIRVNLYTIAKGEQKSVVLYWYQSRERVIASEYVARMYLVADAIRYNRTDTALVRITIPIEGDQEDPAMDAAIRFVQSCFPHLDEFLPK